MYIVRDHKVKSFVVCRFNTSLILDDMGIILLTYIQGRPIWPIWDINVYDALTADVNVDKV